MDREMDSDSENEPVLSLANLSLETVMTGLAQAKLVLSSYLPEEKETPLPEDMAFAEAFYHVEEAYRMLQHPAVHSALEGLLEANRSELVREPASSTDASLGSVF